MSERENSGVFALADRLAWKARSELIGADLALFDEVAAARAQATQECELRRERRLREPAHAGQEALERDLEIRRLTARLQVLNRFALDTCIGRTVDDAGVVTYIGRIGLVDPKGKRLLVDWRTPAAEAFFAASGGNPMGLTSRRRYQWSAGRIVDYWDEPLGVAASDTALVLDEQSAFIASLGHSRSRAMRDVLATINSDQDNIIRADAHGALVVDGGPGTGKTVVALHRAAFLSYSASQKASSDASLLFVGPHRPYLNYIDDVLPSLGEDGALVCTLADLVAGGGLMPTEADPRVAGVKADPRLGDAIRAATALWEHPPTTSTVIDTAWGEVTVTARQWSEIFSAASDGIPHNEVRGRAWDLFLDVLVDLIEAEPRRDDLADAFDSGIDADSGFDAYWTDAEDDDDVRETLTRDDELRGLFERIWPVLDPDALVRGLWRSAPMLKRCAPWLSDDARDALVEASDRPWTDADLPLLDLARTSIGDPFALARRDAARAEEAAAQDVMADALTHLIDSDDTDMHVMAMLRGQDLRRTLTYDAEPGADPLAGPFSHIVVDEAQELTGAQWQMLIRRCPSRSFTIVGDRAQARAGFTESWEQRLAAAGIPRARVASLTVNYRTPAEVMDPAGVVIRQAIPDANVPTSIRKTGRPVRYGKVADLGRTLDAWLDAHSDGIAVVIGDESFPARDRVQSLSPTLVKGLEFDFVVLVEPKKFGPGIAGTVDQYVAMTRATQDLVILED